MRTLSRRLGDDRGSATIEMAILFPIVLALLLSCVQVGMWWHTRNLTLAAANVGLQAGRTTDGTAATAEDAAYSYLTRVGAGAVVDPSVAATSSDAVVRVEVSATAHRVLPIPGLDIRVTQVAEGARERFTTPDAP